MKMDLIDRATLPDVRMEIPKRLDDETTRILNAVIKAFLTVIKSAPTVDAEPVRHGRWIMRGGYIRCSECDAKTLWKDTGGTGGFSHEYEQVRSVHCHNCGAKMDAEGKG